MLWENLREEEFAPAIEKSKGVCVMPVACIEKHGQHLPVNTDILVAEATAKLAAEIEDVCIFPTFKFGEIGGIRQHRGSVILSVELQMQILKETCSEIARNGFKKIILLNGHGGNGTLLNHFVNSLLYEKNDYAVVFRRAYDTGIGDIVHDLDNGIDVKHLTEEDKETIRDFVYNHKVMGHACLEETSLIMAIAPELVKLERMYQDNGLPTGVTADYAKWGMSNATRFWYLEHPDHYSAHHPEKATATIGRALLDKYVERQVGAVRLLKQDDRLLEWNKDWYAKWVE